MAPRPPNGPDIAAPQAGPRLNQPAPDAAHVEGPHVEVTVARGHTLVGGTWDALGRGTTYGPGQKALVPERDVARLVRLGVILTPQTDAEPLVVEPPPIDQPVPKVEVSGVAG